jgi:hypothetical protein
VKAAASLPRLAFQSLPAPPPDGTVQTFDGYFPALAADTYTIELHHTLTPPNQPDQRYSATQTVVVQAPEFTIDTTIVQSVYPPNGGSDRYGEVLPFIVLEDPALPWERNIVPDGAQAIGPANPTPWLALLIFAQGGAETPKEIYLQPGTSSPVRTMTVDQLLTSDPNVLTPQLPAGWVPIDVLASQCQTITITGDAFNAVMPQLPELPFLAHCRGVNAETEGQTLLSVLIGNRLAIAAGTDAVRYYAHLVSLEGFASYLGPNGTPLPKKPNSQDLVDVRLVSLFNWTFMSLPEQGLSFAELIAGLIDSEQTTPVLALPAPDGANLPPVVRDRLDDGYAPLTFVSGSGDVSFAWYRGPLSAVVPRKLPMVGEPQVPVSEARTADSLMIYLAEQGLFDLSYAAAWNIGRALALADAQFAEAVNATRLAANRALGAIAQKFVMPHLAGENTPAALLTRDIARRGFARRMAGGLGQDWTDALARARTGEAVVTVPGTRRARTIRRRAALAPPRMLALAEVSKAIAGSIQEHIQSIADWIVQLRKLETTPFSYLVPNPAMLPIESIRFFYVDEGWRDALTAGALSIGVHHSGDLVWLDAVRGALRGVVRAAVCGGTNPPGITTTGVLIRSQLIANWPALVIAATAGGAPVTIVRDETLSPTVRLCLFEGVPDTVALAEPYQGLRFGVEDNAAVYPRAVTLPSAVGGVFANVPPVTATFRMPPAKAIGGVVQVQPLAAALASATGVTPFAADAVVSWNGTALATTFVSAQEVTAAVPAALVANAGTANVTIASDGATSAPVAFVIIPPPPPGDAASHASSFRVMAAGSNPAIARIKPTVAVATAQGQAFTLTVNGANFGADSVVQWNGAALATTFDDEAQVTATVPASLVTTAGTANVTVLSGGVVSNALPFTITARQPVIGLLDPRSAIAGSDAFVLHVYGGFGAGDFAIQMIKAPEAQSFIPTHE